MSPAQIAGEGGWAFAQNFPWIVALVVVLATAVIFASIKTGSYLKAKLGPAELEIRPPERGPSVPATTKANGSAETSAPPSGPTLKTAPI